jgi:hypothetical protein
LPNRSSVTLLLPSLLDATIFDDRTPGAAG